MKNLKWQGKEVKVENAWLKVYENKEHPLWWSNFEVDICNSNLTMAANYAIIEALKITYEDSIFYISNHLGIGIRKLRKGGWPNHQHFSFHNIQECEVKHGRSITTSFCLKEYEKHESARRKWQQKNFPHEFAKSERLRKMLIK